MIREFTSQDRKLYVEMASEFYHSPAVLHPVPDAFFERTADEALGSDAYAQIYMLECDGEPAGYGLTAKTFSQEAGSRRICDLAGGALYQGTVPFQRAWKRIFCICGKEVCGAGGTLQTGSRRR